MNQIICENEAVLLCTRQQDGVCILRCRTADPILRLPETVGGLPVVALGDYLCAAREPDVSQYDVFKVRLTTGEQVSSAPVHDARAIERVVVPRSVQAIGSYAFYNCYNLQAVTVHAGLRSVGHGAFMNCTAFRQVELYAGERDKTCLSDLLGQTSGELLAILHLPQAEARLIFPPFNEELEDLGPAHIFQRRIEGAGYAYRQCIQNGVLSFLQYDGAFERLLRIQDYDTACRVALLRLRWPVGLSAQAREVYLTCLREHPTDAVRTLLDSRDVPGLSALLSFGVLDRGGLSAACDLARQMGQTEALALLLAALDRAIGRAAPCRQKTYDL